MTAINLGKNTSGQAIDLPARYLARHGLIAGATGTGKSYTIARLTEQFAQSGIPVFLVDVKGDLSGLARSTPCRFVDVFGKDGAALSIRARDMGADLMSRALNLSEAQSGALDMAFAFARDARRPLDSISDLLALLGHIESNRRALAGKYGHITPASLGVIRRACLRLSSDGAADLFKAPGFGVARLLDPGATILEARRLSESPALYGATLAHILCQLYTALPEIGDSGAPVLAMFLDESHLIFTDMPEGLLRKIERIVRLIRSKGVALFFASQSPGDIPAPIAAQLGTRIQHGLRGATPALLRDMRAACDTMPQAAGFDAIGAILRLGVGQALCSVIDPRGKATPAQVVNIAAPRASLVPIDDTTRAAMTDQPAAPDLGDNGRAILPRAFLVFWLLVAAAALGFIALS